MGVASEFTRRHPSRETGQLCAAGPPIEPGSPIAAAALIEFAWSPPDDRPKPTSGIVRQLWRDLRTFSLTDAREAFEAAEYALISGGCDTAGDGFGDLFAIHAMTLILEDDTLNAAAAADQALRRGASGALARMSKLVVRFCVWKAGAAPASSDESTISALQVTSALHSGSPNDVLADVLDLTLAAAIEFSRLQVQAAERLARCALRLAERGPMICVSPAAVLGRILYAQGLVKDAEQLLRPRLPLLRRAGSLDCIEGAYGVLAAAAAHAGDFATALATLDEASELAEVRDWPRLQAAVLAERVRLCAPDGERRAALWLEQLGNLAERHRPRTRCARSEIARHLLRAQIHAYLKFRMGPPPRAAIALLRHDAGLAEDLQSAAWVGLAEAQCLWAMGEEEGGLCRLVALLKSAEATGLRQYLVDAGPLLAPMIERLLHDGCVDQSLLTFAICLMEELERPSFETPSRRRPRPSSGSNRLSARESDVLKLIGEGRTNKVIAQMRGVAPETIKTHVKNIFLKLGVERRAQAVAKAERLGML